MTQTALVSSVNCSPRKGVSVEEVECTQSADDALRPQNRLRVRLNMPKLRKTPLRDHVKRQRNLTDEVPISEFFRFFFFFGLFMTLMKLIHL